MSNALPRSDPIYKRLYAFPRMVADLLRSLFADAEIGADYDTLERLPAEYVGDVFQQRRGDTAWRLRARSADHRGGWLHVLVMLEFQSGADSSMALRVLEYTALLYRELLRAGSHAPGALPPVLPVVLYNGDSPWRPATEMRELIAAPPPALAPCQPSQRHFVLDERRVRAEELKLHELTLAVAQLEQSRSVADLARVARRLTERLSGTGEGELRRTFADWLRTLERRLGAGDQTRRPPDDLSLEDMTVSLEERVAEWPKPYIQQGREEGRREGIEQQRQMLRRLASARFGAATGDRLAAAIGAEADPQRLMDVAEAIVRCTTGSELLREIGVTG